MRKPDIVLETNVIIAALRSKRGASFRLLSLLGGSKFAIHDSVALVLEYEEVMLRQRAQLGLSVEQIRLLIDSLCALATHHEIHYHWRPTLAANLV